MYAIRSYYVVLCTLLAVPGMLLLLKVAPWNGDQEADVAEPVLKRT